MLQVRHRDYRHLPVGINFNLGTGTHSGCASGACMNMMHECTTTLDTQRCYYNVLVYAIDVQMFS